jgi:UDP-4-amino-4,6-dideoxy-N-acetyl-beta-L-altrosamine N-acetyltransferase
MKLSKYNIILTRLTEDKIELVRNWRNDDKIAVCMEYRDKITPEMQVNWFRKINNENNYYFIIEYDKKEIGLIDIRDIDYTIKEGEGGIFIYDDNYINTDVSFRACLCLIDYCFEVLHLERIIGHILKDNKRSIKFSELFGYKIEPDQECVYNQRYTLNPGDYYKQREIIINLFNL